MVSGDFCEHGWAGSGCPTCRKEQEQPSELCKHGYEAKLCLLCCNPTNYRAVAISIPLEKRRDIINAITEKADQCKRLAETSLGPSFFEYRAKEAAFREAIDIIRKLS